MEDLVGDSYFFSILTWAWSPLDARIESCVSEPDESWRCASLSPAEKFAREFTPSNLSSIKMSPNLFPLKFFFFFTLDCEVFVSSLLR